METGQKTGQPQPSVLDPATAPAKPTQQPAGQPQVEAQVADENGNKVLKKFKAGGGNGAVKRVYMYMVVGLLVVIAGGVTGRIMAGGSGGGKTMDTTVVTKDGEVTEAGLDESEFSDEPAEGMLVLGGIEDEGTHHLDRGMGPEKDVYLFSTALDMGPFVGKKVKVWGKSVSAKSAPWLMDVGRIKVLE